MAIDLDRAAASGPGGNLDTEFFRSFHVDASDFKPAGPAHTAVLNLHLQAPSAVSSAFELLRCRSTQVAIALPIQIQNPAARVVTIQNPSAILALDNKVVSVTRVAGQTGGFGLDDHGLAGRPHLPGECAIGGIVHRKCVAPARGGFGRSGGKRPRSGPRN